MDIRKSLILFAVAVWFIALGPGCYSIDDADSGAPRDAGGRSDTGGLSDVGDHADSGNHPDSGPGRDAGPRDGGGDGGSLDTGLPEDTGLPADIGYPSDAGGGDETGAQSDTGNPADTGAESDAGSGCPGGAGCVIDLATVVYHTSIDVSGWPVTKTVTSVQLSPNADEGVKLTMDPYNPTRDADPWPDFIMWPPDGHLRWTLWLFVRFGGQWHGAAVLEFWCDREWSGAPLLTNYADWIYPNPGSPWGEMGDYAPAEGDTVGFMATAGDLRRHKDYLTVNERSNVVTVPLVPSALYTFQ